MQYIFWTLIFLFGAALGSFISVIANRYNTGLSFWFGRSFCFSCNTLLRKIDMFPILSFIRLRGLCRYCGSKIPHETFFTEIIMGFLSVLAALKSGLFPLQFPLLLATSYWLLTVNYLLLTSIFAVILLISVYDLKHLIIPNSFLIVLSAFSLIYVCIFLFPAFDPYFTPEIVKNIFIRLASIVVVPLPFLILFFISKGRWIGMGDVKYMAVLGLLLGISSGFAAVILSFWIGAAFSIIAIAVNRLKRHLPNFSNNLTIKSEIPFGPFLSLGIIISLYFNVDLSQIQKFFQIFF